MDEELCLSSFVGTRKNWGEKSKLAQEKRHTAHADEQKKDKKKQKENRTLKPVRFIGTGKPVFRTMNLRIRPNTHTHTHIQVNEPFREVKNI